MRLQTIEVQPILSAKEAAAILGTTEAVLAVWRSSRRVDIPFYKIGASVKYKLDDLNSFLNANVHGGVH